MIPRVVHVEHLHDYVLAITFLDGLRAEIDLSSHVLGQGGIFAPLEDTAFFSQVRVDPEIGTIVWPNDVDFCPELLHELALNQARTSMSA